MIDITGKEWLRYVRAGTRRIEVLNETKQRLFEAATAITANYSGAVVSGSGTSRRPENYAVALQDEQIEFWIKRIRATTEAIYKIADPTLQTVLELYYIDGLTWDDVAERMHYSREHICRKLHPEALAQFVIPETYR